MRTIGRHVAVAQHRIRNRIVASLVLTSNTTVAILIPSELWTLLAFATARKLPVSFFDSFAYDWLHFNENGVLRHVTDEIHNVFDNQSQYNGISDGSVAAIANQWITGIPCAARMHRFRAFTTTKGENLSEVTRK